MHSQLSPSRNTSAATQLPYDILREVFSHCLPATPLDEVQPNTKLAPMLLCHICLSWRIAALESPHLWQYLYHRLPLHWKNGRPVAWDSKIFSRDMECLKWCRQNQGSRAPFIRFLFYQPKGVTITQSHEPPLTHDDMQFFVEYLSSAQYLDVGRFAAYILQQDPIRSTSRTLCPNLQSLVTRHPNNDEHMRSPRLVSFHIAPTLRRLCIHHIQLPTEYMGAFAHWTGLTHLSLHDTFMAPDVWFSLIRAVPNLQWGYFDIFLGIALTYNILAHEPPEFTLPFLSMLSVTLDKFTCDSNAEEEPFRQLLVNLHLPALHDLSIYIDADPWNPPSVATKINNGLVFAPSVTKLTLALQFLGFQFLGFVDASNLQTTGWEGVDKLSTLAPHLTHLVLDLCHMHPNYNYRITLQRRLAYWKEFLPPMRWLDLANPASAIRKISVVVKEPAKDGPMVEDVFRNALRLGKVSRDKGTKIVLEVVPEDKKGLAPYAEGYKTWGCSL